MGKMRQQIARRSAVGQFDRTFHKYFPKMDYEYVQVNYKYMVVFYKLCTSAFYKLNLTCIYKCHSVLISVLFVLCLTVI